MSNFIHGCTAHSFSQSLPPALQRKLSILYLITRYYSESLYLLVRHIFLRKSPQQVHTIYISPALKLVN